MMQALRVRGGQAIQPKSESGVQFDNNGKVARLRHFLASPLSRCNELARTRRSFVSAHEVQWKVWTAWTAWTL
jgi:hypothetical protein